MDLTGTEVTITTLLADDDTLPFAVTDADGDAANITGVTFTFRVLPNQYSPVADKLIEKGHAELLTGIVITNAGGGLGEVSITAENKAAALDVGTYWCELHMVQLGVDTTIMRGPYVVEG